MINIINMIKIIIQFHKKYLLIKISENIIIIILIKISNIKQMILVIKILRIIVNRNII